MTLLPLLALFPLLALWPLTVAAGDDTDSSKGATANSNISSMSEPQAAPKGSLCTDCHSPEVNPGLHSIWQSPHGAAMGQGNTACVKCHGDSDEHRLQPNEHSPTVSFGPSSPSPSLERDGQCLQCHKGGDRIMWSGSSHQQEDMSCSNCHQMHARRDKILDDRQQTEVCVECHRQMKSLLKLPSRHPIEEGKTSCSDCHNPHGSTTEANLRGISLNDTCTQCHSEKRGPFLFEHQPVQEDCSLCHRPHGSVNAHLLNNRTPFLCQQCHSVAFHPSQLNDGSGLVSGSRNQNMLGKSCLNCHGQVHGSNHPSSGRLTR